MELTPAGKHPATLMRVADETGEAPMGRWGRSSNNNVYVLLYFNVLGTRLAWFGTFAKGSYKRTLEALRYCGLKGDDVVKGLETQPMDQEVEVVVEHEEYEGKWRAKIAWVNRPGGAIKLEKPLSKDELVHFTAQIRNALKSVAEVEGKRAERKTTTAAPAATNGKRPVEQQHPFDPSFDQSVPTNDPFGADGGEAGDDIPF